MRFLVQSIVLMFLLTQASAASIRYDGVDYTASTTYYRNGNKQSETDGTENKTGDGVTTDITTYSYDQLDRKQSTTQRGRTIDYDYDLNGNRTRVSSAGGRAFGGHI